MTCYKEQYGADRDGNRSLTGWSCEIDKYDKDDIIEQIIEAITEGTIESYADTLTIVLINPYTEEEVYFEAEEVSEYMTKVQFDTYHWVP